MSLALRTLSFGLQTPRSFLSTTACQASLSSIFRLRTSWSCCCLQRACFTSGASVEESGSEVPPLTSQWLAGQLRKAGVASRAKLALAVSGGVDSMALAVLASRLPNYSATALVVDHALRPESAQEAQQVCAWLDCLGLAPQVLTLQWPQGRPPPGKLQEAAREARYSVLGSACHAHGLVPLLTAHHWDDQAELFLMRLARGSGLAGLAGMDLFCHMQGAGTPLPLVRPLLDVNKAQLRQVCEAAGQAWVEDPSNASPIFFRNRVRAVLQDPQAGLSLDDIAAALSLCRRLKGSLEQQTKDALRRATEAPWAGVQGNQYVLDADCLAMCPPAVQAAVVQHVVRTVGPQEGGRPLRSRALQGLLSHLANKGGKKRVRFSLGTTDGTLCPPKKAARKLIFAKH